MGTVATILALCFEWGGVCIDVLGVASPAAIWGEWIASGPLLIFITVTIIDKPHLTRLDWFFMITFFLCLVAGFLIIIPQSYGLGLFWLAVSCLTYVPVLGLPWYDSDIRPIVELEGRALHIFAEGYAKRYNLVMELTIVLPLYTVNYLVALSGTINAAQTIAIYQILSVLTKGLFAASTMDIHMDLLFNAEKLLLEEQRANDARRAFMKYIFHEVRTPLNSLTMGIDLLEMSENINASERDSLLMMRSASEFMSDTLDNVLSLQKIEEGKFELELVAFSFEQIVLRGFATFQGAVVKKNISLSHNIFPTVPMRVIGDVHRIEHVFSNLLSNAIKFSPEGKSVRVEILCDGYSRNDDDHEIANVTVSVEDKGAGISSEDQAKLFNSFVQIRPGTIQKGQGSGLGLSFCKQIVEFHGGIISVTSIEGCGSKFQFTIPFPLASPSENQHSVACPSEMQHSSKKNNSFRPAVPVQSLIPAESLLPTPAVKSMVDLEAQVLGAGKPSLLVLVVDDADSNRKMLTMRLKKKGLIIEAREDGQRGLGLSFCKQIVEFHGGAISVASTEGSGSKFQFTIPFPVAPPSENQHSVACPSENLHSVASPSENQHIVACSPRQQSSKKGSSFRPAMLDQSLIPVEIMLSAPNVKSMVDLEAQVLGAGKSALSVLVVDDADSNRKMLTMLLQKKGLITEAREDGVLVVDDADSNRKMLTMLLKKKGLIIEAREDGQRAVDLVLEDLHKFQLVLMDNLMPVMNGQDAARSLRDHGYPYLIIGITGNSMEDDLVAFLGSGADMVISKPLKKRTLDLIFEFIEEYGAYSRPDMKLALESNKLSW
eukprot:CAMPEP_0119051700 /NCGR_PEP_ID=MMETSP1177-20130426/73233_1 /TAXON_ID=2985 /ORGANISM="Ochromonas sp, Strain CCMP1899" /LENGTH=828 /DNA_ID=CAMNT_0007031009 /DNA_START=692 /DNA_END=3175 /DNA_ORIENTATION=+